MELMGAVDVGSWLAISDARQVVVSPVFAWALSLLCGLILLLVPSLPRPNFTWSAVRLIWFGIGAFVASCGVALRIAAQPGNVGIHWATLLVGGTWLALRCVQTGAPGTSLADPGAARPPTRPLPAFAMLVGALGATALLAGNNAVRVFACVLAVFGAAWIARTVMAAREPRVSIPME